MAQDGLVSEVDEWFGHGECHGSQSGAEASNKQQSFHRLNSLIINLKNMDTLF